MALQHPILVRIFGFQHFVSHLKLGHSVYWYYTWLWGWGIYIGICLGIGKLFGIYLGIGYLYWCKYGYWVSILVYNISGYWVSVLVYNISGYLVSILVNVETRQSNLAVKGRRSSGLSGKEQRSEAVDAHHITDKRNNYSNNVNLKYYDPFSGLHILFLLNLTREYDSIAEGAAHRTS